MNPRMWLHPATRRNAAQLTADGIAMIGPNVGEMAERGEAGPGRMAEPLEIAARIEALLGVRTVLPGAGKQVLPEAGKQVLPKAGQQAGSDTSLGGRHVLVTAGPTHEPIDPVRYIANRSSGKQGFAIAAACARRGARVTLVSGPVGLPDPAGGDVIRGETAAQMWTAGEGAMTADVGVFAAAVADWRVASAASEKIKKGKGATPSFDLVENPDILRSIARKGPQRPTLVVGFAAETENVIEHARDKRKRKGCDWIVANDVSPETGVMGGNRNTVHVITADGVESWPEMDKDAVADALAQRIADHLALGQADV